jgi:uncharacterized protein YkwD
VIRLLLLAALLLSSLPLIGQATTVEEYCVENPVELEFLALINGHRAANGAPPVVLDHILGTAAEHHAIDMGQRNVLDHWLADGTSWADNIRAHGFPAGAGMGQDLAGSRATAMAVLIAWSNSPAHNALMLDPFYVSIGIARWDDGGATEARYWWALNMAGPTAETHPAVICGEPTVTPAPEPTATPKPCKRKGRWGCHR